MRKFFTDILHRWLTTLLVSVCWFSLFTWKVNAPVHTLAIMLLLLFWTAALCAVDKLWRHSAVLAVLSIVFFLVIAAGDREQMGAYLSAVIWGGNPELSLSGDMVMGLLFALISVCTLYLYRSFWTRAVLCVCWVVFWIISAFAELDVPRLALSCMAPVILFTLSEGIHRFCKKGTHEHFESISPGLMALFMTASLLLSMVPVSDEPYGYPLLNYIWDQMKEIYNNVEIRMHYRTEGNEQFELSFSGYSDDAHIADGLTASSSGVLFAQPVRDTDGLIYLIGNTWDTFTGNGWVSNVDSESEELLDWKMDTAEHIYAFWRYQQDNDSVSTDSFIRNNSIYFSYRGLKIRTLFSTGDTLRIYTDTDRFPWEAQAGRILFDYVQDHETFYRLYFLELNGELLPQIVTYSQGYEYDTNKMLTWQMIHRSYFSKFQLAMDQFGRVEWFLSQRQNMIRNAYMEVPGDVSDRVRALAGQITAGCGSDYEKLEAISEYLQSNYTYTTMPDPVPDGVPFLDHVLFEAQEGYCTWFATAATILARCAGIPARYVQGYCLPLEGGRFTSITNSNSHAWCEGYITGYGWVTVEATPGYSASGTRWDQGSQGQSSALDHQDEATTPEETQAPMQNEDGEERANERHRKLAIAVLTVFAAALSVLLLVTALRMLRKKMRYDAADYGEKAVMDLEKALKNPARRSYIRRPNESLRQYFERLKWSAHMDTELIRRMSDLYEQILFNDRKITKEEWQECRRFAAMLRKTR